MLKGRHHCTSKSHQQIVRFAICTEPGPGTILLLWVLLCINYCLPNRTKWILIHGTKYKGGAIVHVGYDDWEHPKFCEIIEIVVISNGVFNAIFVVSEKETVRFSEHYQAYEIATCKEKKTKVNCSTDLTSHLPFNLIKPFGCHGKNICLRYDIDM